MPIQSLLSLASMAILCHALLKLLTRNSGQRVKKSAANARALHLRWAKRAAKNGVDS